MDADMRTDAPDVSVVIAAYQAQDFIARAINSVLAQEHQSFEILVAPDEADDYGFLTRRDPRIRLVDPVAAPTGPAAARNRAVAVARGRFIALLDADDYWSRDYLVALLPLAERHGVAYGRTEIADWRGTPLRSIPAASVRPSIGFDDFATAYGSLHGLVRRDAARRWQPLLAEDVLYDLESLGLAGGTAPYAAEAVYTLRVRGQSLSHSDHFIRTIDAEYARLIVLIEGGETMVPPEHVAAAAAVFRSWQRMNARFAADWKADPQLEFHAFIAALPPS